MLSILRSMQLGVRRRSLCNHRRKIISGKLRTSTQVCEPSTHLAKLNATVTFDFQQNLPLPHIFVGDVFYVRQLWLYVFGVHECGFKSECMLLETILAERALPYVTIMSVCCLFCITDCHRTRHRSFGIPRAFAIIRGPAQIVITRTVRPRIDVRTQVRTNTVRTQKRAHPAARY